MTGRRIDKFMKSTLETERAEALTQGMRVGPDCRSESQWRVAWFEADDCSLVADSVISFARNVVRDGRIESVIVIRKRPMSAIPAADDCNPLQLFRGLQERSRDGLTVPAKGSPVDDTTTGNTHLRVDGAASDEGQRVALVVASRFIEEHRAGDRTFLGAPGKSVFHKDAPGATTHSHGSSTRHPQQHAVPGAFLRPIQTEDIGLVGCHCPEGEVDLLKAGVHGIAALSTLRD